MFVYGFSFIEDYELICSLVATVLMHILRAITANF